MSTNNTDNHKAQLTEIAKAIGAILGAPLALFAVVHSITAQPITSLIVALITAILMSVWVILSRWVSITQIITAWLALTVVVLAGFVIWPRTMTVEGFVYDTAGNPVSNEKVRLFDSAGMIYETQTDAEGYYQFVVVPTGKYKLRVRGNEIEGETKGFLVRLMQQKLTISQASSGTVTPGTPIVTPTLTPQTSLVTITAIYIKSELQPDGTVKRTAQLSIEDLGYGALQLTAPSTIKLGESGVVRLTITPDSALSNLLPVSVDIASASDPSYGISINDRIQIYPVMIAELEGVNFEICPSGPQRIAVTSQSQVVWSWSVTAKATGKQSLILTIFIPVLIDQTSEEISHQLKEIPIHVFVEVTPVPTPSQTPSPMPTLTPTPTSTPLPVAQRIVDQLIDKSASIVTALIALSGVLAGVYASIQNSKRQAKIEDLKRQIELAKGEKELEALKSKLAHLESIPRWQFWRRR